MRGGNVLLANSTLSSNVTVGCAGQGDYLVGDPGGDAYGGGVCLDGGTLRLVNCTLSGNTARGGPGAGGAHYGGDGGAAYGGGIFAGGGTISLVNCTVYQNVAAGGAGGYGGTQYPYHGGAQGFGSGAGIYTLLGGPTLLNTILQGSYGAFSSQGYNLLENGSGTSGWVASDRTNASFSLDVLDDYGGTTLTHALLADSPATDAGTSSGALRDDQRGIARPQNLAVDIGAFEAEFGPPHILAISSNQQVIVSADVTFVIRVLSAVPMSVQWFHDSVALPEATNTMLTLRNVQVHDTGSYTVTVNNAFGSVASAPTILTVLPLPPSITSAPANLTRAAGSTATFAATASGSTPLHFQWQYNGRNIRGATSNVFTLDQLSVCDAGAYTVVVRNAFGAVTSSVASLTVIEPSQVVAWGSTAGGATVVPAGLSNVIDIAAGAQTSLALTGDGQVVAWGNNDSGQTNVPAGLSGVVAVSAGDRHNLALKQDGTVVAWGWNYWGQTDVPQELTGVAAVAAGGCHSMALLSNGTVVVWGDCGTGVSYVPMGLSDVASIAAGFSHCLALKRNGTVAAWGSGYFGQTNVPSRLANVVLIAARADYSMAATGDGRIVAWGDHPEGWPINYNAGFGPGVLRALSAGARHAMALREDGTVVVWGQDLYGYGLLNPPANLWDVSRIAAGNFYSLALRARPSPPLVRQMSSNQMVLPGERLTLNVTASGTPPLFYQWRQNGTNIAGSTCAILRFPWIDDSHAGQYSVLIANTFGVITSAVVQVMVLHPVQLSSRGGGTIDKSPNAAGYTNGQSVTLTATPWPGWTFLQWLGDVAGTNAVTTVQVKNRSLCAQALFGTSLSIDVTGDGSVLVDPAATLYPHGTVARLTAVPQVGNYFASWGGAAAGTNNPLSFAVTDANPTVTAVFQPLDAGQFALAVVADGFGAVTTSPRGNCFYSGQSMTLTALPEAGQNFLNWSGDANDTQNPLTLALNQSHVITAYFTKRPILALQPCSDPSLDDRFQLLLTGEFGARYEVQKNDDWQGWLPLGAVTNLFGTSQFSDETATNTARRVYRAVLAP